MLFTLNKVIEDFAALKNHTQKKPCSNVTPLKDYSFFLQYGLIQLCFKIKDFRFLP